MKKEEIFKFLPAKVKFEIFIDEELNKKGKLYKRQKIAEILKSSDGNLRNIISEYVHSGKIGRIVINKSSYIGSLKTIKKIKEMLIE